MTSLWQEALLAHILVGGPACKTMWRLQDKGEGQSCPCLPPFLSPSQRLKNKQSHALTRLGGYVTCPSPAGCRPGWVLSQLTRDPRAKLAKTKESDGKTNEATFLYYTYIYISIYAYIHKYIYIILPQRHCNNARLSSSQWIQSLTLTVNVAADHWLFVITW